MIRAVVVVTDGRANRGAATLSLLAMTSTAEVAIESYRGFDDDFARDVRNRQVPKSNVVGTALAVTQHRVRRSSSQSARTRIWTLDASSRGATGAEFQGATEEDLAEVLEEFSRYF